MLPFVRASLGLAFTSLLVGCGSGHAAGPDPATEPPPPVSIVNSTVVVADCPDAQRMNARQAQREIRDLVQPCSKVPGGAAHFSATLLPNGRIKLASPAGDRTEGVVPTCVLTNPLVHHVRLSSACKLDVELEERKLGEAAPPAP